MIKTKAISLFGRILAFGICMVTASVTLTAAGAPLTATSQSSLSSFTSIAKFVKGTLYTNPKYNTPKASGKSAFDFNKDGKKEAISFTYKYNDEDMGNLMLTVGSATVKLKPMYFDAIYYVDLDKSDKSVEIAVQMSAEDDDVYTDFYRYNGKLVKLGEVYGNIADNRKGMLFGDYNSGILTDGKGDLIPRFGAIQFVSPQILREYLTLRGNKLVDVKPNLSSALNKTYTVSGNSTPFFEPMSVLSKNFMPRCQTSDQITLKKGEKITIKSISSDFGNMYCMLVQLPNKKTGVLYYFLHP